MARIVKLKENDTVPQGAKFLYVKTEKEYSHSSTEIYDDLWSVLSSSWFCGST